MIQSVSECMNKKNATAFRLLTLSLILLLPACRSASADSRPEFYSLEELRNLDKGILEREKSNFSSIRVTKDQNTITLSFEKGNYLYTESRINLKDPYDLQIAYAKFMSAGLLYPEKTDQVLMLGYGGGSVTEYLRYHNNELEVDGVEIDPVVIKMAKRYFLVRPSERNRIHITDARKFVQQTGRKYDLVFADAFGGGFVPSHLVTLEFFQEVKDILTDDGCMVANLYEDGIHQKFLAAYYRLFETVEVYPTGVNASRITVACKGKPPTEAELRARAERLDRRYKYHYPLSTILKMRKIVKPDEGMEPYRD